MKSFFTKQRTLNLVLIIICSLSILSFFSCSEENEIEEITKDNYYVKYIITTNRYDYIWDWTVSTPDGVDVFSDDRTAKWEQVYGPVEKGFICSVNVTDSGGRRPYIEIYVSMNNEPFALKTSVESNTASFRID
jgi:hypothetical protein